MGHRVRRRPPLRPRPRHRPLPDPTLVGTIQLRLPRRQRRGRLEPRQAVRLCALTHAHLRHPRLGKVFPADVGDAEAWRVDGGAGARVPDRVCG